MTDPAPHLPASAPEVEVTLTAEVAEFLGRGCTPEEVLDFHPSEEASERVGDLIARSKRDAGLTAEERVELDRALHLEHLVRLAKKNAAAALDAERAVAA